MASSLGSLLVSLGLDAAEFTQGLTKAEYQAQQFRDRASKHFNDVGASLEFLKGALKGIAGGISVSLFTGMFTDAVKAAGALDDLAEKTGISVESLSALQEVARVGGHDFNAITASIGKVNKSLTELYNPASKASLALAQIGLSAKDLEGKDAASGLRLISQQLGNFSDAGPGKAAFAIAFMGKAGAEALPFIKDLGEATDFTATTTAKEAAAAEDLEKDIKRLGKAKQDIVRTISFALVPALDDLVKAFLQGRKESSGFKDTIDGLAADGSLQRWFQDIALYIATTADEFNKIIGLVEKFKTLGGAAAEEAGGLAKIAAGGNLENLGGDPAEAQKLIAEGWKQVNDAHAKYVKGVDDGQKKQTNYERVLQQFREREAKDRATAGGAAAKPALNFQGGREKLGPSDDPAKKVLEGQLKALQADIEREKALLSTREEYLAAYYQHGDLSIKQFYDDQANVRKLALDKQEKDSADSIKLLEARNALPTKTTPQDFGVTEVERQDNLNKIDEIEKKSAAARTEYYKKEYQAQTQRNLADDAYLDTLGEINAKILELGGNSAAAAKIRFDAQNAQLRRSLTSSGDTAARDAVDRLGKQAEVQGALNDQQKRFGLITEEVSIAQERINLAQSTGAITEIEALQRTSELNRSRIKDLTVIADAYELIARQSQDPADIQKAQRLRLEIEKLSAATDLVADKFNKIFSDSFTSFFDDLVSGTKSFKDAFKDLERSIVKSISNIASQNLAQALFGGGGTGAASGIGGWFASLFGGGSGAGAASSFVDLGGFFASGGNPPVGKASVVGENGPELFVPKVAGTIVANDAAFGGKGVTIHGGLNISVPAGTSRASADQIGAAVASHLARASRRNS